MMPLRPFKKTTEHVISFCERCGSACDPRCRAEEIREQAHVRALLYGWRQS